MADWRKRIREPRVWVLIALGIFSLVILAWFSSALIPLFGAMIIGYLLDPLVIRLEQWRVPRLLAVVLVMLGSILLVALVLFAIIPTVAEQLNALANQVPDLITKAEQWVGEMQGRLPESFRGEGAWRFLDRLSIAVDNLFGGLVTMLLAWAGGTIGGLVNAIIIGFLVFFLLKDKEKIWAYLVRLLPLLQNEQVVEVLADIDRQMGKFIKGKFIVVFLLFLLSTGVYWIIGLDFFLLLGIMTGLSTFIPYIGAIVVGIPVVAVGLLQWGLSGAIGTLIAYVAVQIVDGNLMTPVIIGRETDIHPIGIIAAIVICGSLWGFWGVVFAVPAAVIVKSILDVLYFPSLARAAAGDGGGTDSGPAESLET